MNVHRRDRARLKQSSSNYLQSSSSNLILNPSAVVEYCDGKKELSLFSVSGGSKRIRLPARYPLILGSFQPDVRRLNSSFPCEEVDLELRLGFRAQIQ